MKISNVFVTENKAAKYCEVCHRQLPSDRTYNAKYCSEECKKKGRKLYTRKWYKKNRAKLKDKRDEEKKDQARAFAERSGSSDYTEGLK